MDKLIHKISVKRHEFQWASNKKIGFVHSTYSATHNTTRTEQVEKELSMAKGSACSPQTGNVVAVIFIRVRFV